MKLYISLLFIFLAQFYNAQQEAQRTMYWNNFSIDNPAATGLLHKQFASLTARQEWTSVSGAPKSISFIYDQRFTKISSSFGINFTNDRGNLDFSNTNKTNLNASHQIVFKNDKILSLGTSVSLRKHSFDVDQLYPSDTVISKLVDHVTDINLGAMFKMPKLIAGVSFNNLARSRSTRLNTPFQNKGYLTLTASYEIPVSLDFTVKPGFYLVSNYSMSSKNLDLNVISTYKSKYWAGFSVVSRHNFALMAGIIVKNKYKISYAFNTSPTKNQKNGGHEISLIFQID